MSRWRDPQLQVIENYSDLTKWRSTNFKSCWLTLTVRGSTLVVRIWRQILTHKDGPRAERVNRSGFRISKGGPIWPRLACSSCFNPYAAGTVYIRGGSSFSVRGGFKICQKKKITVKGSPGKYLIFKGFLMQSQAYWALLLTQYITKS